MLEMNKDNIVKKTRSILTMQLVPIMAFSNGKHQIIGAFCFIQGNRTNIEKKQSLAS